MSEHPEQSYAATDVLVSLTRMEAKMDVALAQHGAKISAHGDALDDHEERLRVVESRKTVSPGALWATVGSAVAAFGVAAPYIAALIEGAQ